MLKVLDLFSGIGGFSLGLERTGGFETAAFCEIDPYCRAVLRKHWPDVPIFEDVRALDADRLGTIDLVCGGYPCQPFSVAGRRQGAEDDRHLWPEMHRLVAELRPTWVLGENVAGHITMGLDQVLSDLEASGYATRAFVVPAVAVDAPHRRDRVWIVAHVRSKQHQGCCEAQQGTGTEKLPLADAPRVQSGRQDQWAERERAGQSGQPVVLGDTDGTRQSDGQGRSATTERRGNRAADYPSSGIGGCDHWQPEPDVGRVAAGVPSRVDRLRALGNAVVPQIPEIIGRAILEIEAK